MTVDLKDDSRLVCIHFVVIDIVSNQISGLAFIVRGMNGVTELDRLDRTAIGKIFAVNPCANKQSDDEQEPD